jgi:hypothetical protein
MPDLPPTCLAVDPAPLARARILRLRAAGVLERARSLRRRSDQLLSAPFGSRPHGSPPSFMETADDVETLGWLRVQVQEMLALGWTRAELADIGVRDGILRELGLRWPEPGPG